MNDSSFEIDPLTVTTTTIINKFKIISIQVNLYTSAIITLYLLDESDKVSEIKSLTMSGQDYINWGKDDTYITDWILNTLNLKKKIITTV